MDSEASGLGSRIEESSHGTRKTEKSWDILQENHLVFCDIHGILEVT
jgi:hypothetical protein